MKDRIKRDQFNNSEDRICTEKNFLKREKETHERTKKYRTWKCIRCDEPVWTRQCPVRGKNWTNCGKPGQIVRICRSHKPTDHIHGDETTNSAEEESWMPQQIHLTRQSINSMQTNHRDGNDFYTTTILVSKRPKKTHHRQRITSIANTTTSLH